MLKIISFLNNLTPFINITSLSNNNSSNDKNKKKSNKKSDLNNNNSKNKDDNNKKSKKKKNFEYKDNIIFYKFYNTFSNYYLKNCSLKNSISINIVS